MSPERTLTIKQKRHSVDQIISKLRQADVELGKGKNVPEVCKALQITEQTYHSSKPARDRDRLREEVITL